MAAELGIPAAVTEKYSSKAAGGFISQSIAANSVYQDGDVLELNYSLGNKITIGNFVGQPEDAIQAWRLDQNAQGAKITVSVKRTLNSAPKGTILAQSVSNTLIDYKYTVTITVSKGLTVFMPNFLAPAGSGYDLVTTRDEAMEICAELGIIPVFASKANSAKLPGEIWIQSVAAGTEVAQGSTVTLTYTPAAQTSVPPFVGMTENDVRTSSENYFKKLDIVFEYADENVPGYNNTIYDQSLPAGSTVTMGSKIILYVSPAP
jgi:beta-lactam-binding protein with PASTA domain